jgi:hypothetical protein
MMNLKPLGGPEHLPLPRTSLRSRFLRLRNGVDRLDAAAAAPSEDRKADQDYRLTAIFRHAEEQVSFFLVALR